MSTVFIGGSRRVSRLSTQVKERLDNIVKSGLHVIVGDANGADKAVQKYLVDVTYENTTVFCSGDKCRNNLGNWEMRYIKTPRNVKGFEFYAAKDREMASEADFGLMIWDGTSAGTILNILRLVRTGKKAVLLNVRDKQTTTFKTLTDWEEFLSRSSRDLRSDLQRRAKPEEWKPLQGSQQTSFLDAPQEFVHSSHPGSPVKTDGEWTAKINAALATGDPASVIDALGHIARERGMSQVAKDAGLARESLYRSLIAGGNPEFATVLKVISSLGLRLMASKVHDGSS